MILKMYTIHDIVANVHRSPMFLRSDGEAVRLFDRVVNDPQTDVSKYPNDYHLYYCGDFDDQSARLTPVDVVVLLAKGGDFKKHGAYQADVEDLPPNAVRSNVKKIVESLSK